MAEPAAPLSSKIGPLIDGALKLAAIPAMARSAKVTAVDAAIRAGLAVGASIAGGIGLLCFTYAALTLLQREMDPAAAWAIVGGFYALVGGGLFFAATKGR